MKLRLSTYELPDGEHIVGIEFLSMSEVTTKNDLSKLDRNAPVESFD